MPRLSPATERPFTRTTRSRSAYASALPASAEDDVWAIEEGNGEYSRNPNSKAAAGRRTVPRGSLLERYQHGEAEPEKGLTPSCHQPPKPQSHFSAKSTPTGIEPSSNGLIYLT